MALTLASTLLLTSLCLLVSGGHRVLAQGPDSCPSLETAASSIPGCSPLGNCAGLTCVLEDARNVTFYIKKCTDPLEIDVWVFGSGSDFFQTFTPGGQASNGGVSVSLTATRDDLNDVVNVQIMVDDATVVPSVDVPLNQSVCMCASLKTAAELNVANTIATNCTVNSNCDGIECEFRIFTDYFIEVEWQRCDQPTGVLIALRIHNGALLSEDYFNGSLNANVSSYGIPMYVTMVNTNYSTSLEVATEALDQDVMLVNVSDVLVDKSGCRPPSIEPPPAIPAQPVSMETCSALTALASGDHEAVVTSCNVTKSCSGLTCRTGNIYRTDMQFLSCTQSVFVEVKRFGDVLLAETVAQTKSFQLDFGMASIIIRNISSTVMGVEVDLFTGFNPNNPINLLPYVQIRRADYCLCGENECPSIDVMPSISTPMPVVSTRVLFAVTVPIIFILLIIVIVLVTLVACLAWKKKMRKGEDSIPFQNMTEKLGSDEAETEATSGEGGHEVEVEKKEILPD